MPIRLSERVKDTVFMANVPNTRVEALQVKRRFYKGKPCVHGHGVLRLAANGSCAQCASIRSNKSNTAKRNTEGWKSSRKKTNARWNSSEGAKTAKDRWKAQNPKWAWVVSAVGGAKTRAKAAGVPFSLTNEYVYSITADVCPALSITLSFGGTGKPVPGSASLDRLVPSAGYVVGNVAVISRRANMIKSDAALHEVEAVAAWLRSRR